MALKFGSVAWRKKYAKKTKRKAKSSRRPKSKNPAAVLKKIKALLK